MRPFRLCQSLSRTISGDLSTMEAEMRTMIATLAGLVALTSVSAQAVPLAPAKAIPVQFGAGPSIELARQGCLLSSA